MSFPPVRRLHISPTAQKHLVRLCTIRDPMGQKECPPCLSRRLVLEEMSPPGPLVQGSNISNVWKEKHCCNDSSSVRMNEGLIPLEEIRVLAFVGHCGGTQVVEE